MADRRGLTLLLCMLPACLAGCFWNRPAEPAGWAKSLRPAMPALDENLISLDVAILERPLADPFVNDELWTSVDDMVLDLSRKGTVNKNGFRVGQIVGLTPVSLQTLLKSERYCLNPRRRVIPSGNRVTQVLGPVHPQTHFLLHEEGIKTPVQLDQARFCLDVTATRTKDNKIRLEFTPKVETGERMLPFQPDIDQSQWTLRVEKPHRSFPELSWEVTVEPNKFLIIGTLLEHSESLGFRTFVQEDGRPVQRLLVLRAFSAQGDKAEGEASLEEMMRSTTCPPLALQAAFTRP